MSGRDCKAPGPVEAEMNVENMRRGHARIEGDKQVLAVGERPGECAAVYKGGSAAEPTLRGRGMDDLTVKEFGEGCGNTVNDVALGDL